MGDNDSKAATDTLCSVEEYDMESYDKTDFMLITKALKDIYGVAIDYQEGVLDYPTTYQRVRDLYSYYMCKVKRNIQENKDYSAFVKKTTFGVTIIVMIVTTLLMLRELYYAMRGRVYTTPIVSAIVMILVFNPVYSVIMLVWRGSSIQTSGGVTKERAREIERVEKLLLKAVDTECQGANEGTFAACMAEFVTLYENNIRDHLTARKSERARSIAAFIENCRSFCEKSSSIEYNESTMLTDRIVSLCDMMLEIDEAALTSVMDADVSSDYGLRTLYFKTSAVARRRCADIVMYYEPNANRDDMVSYEAYFVIFLNQCIHELQKSALKFWNQTQGMSGIVTICGSSTIDVNAPYDFVVTKRKLIDMMIVVRRLRYLRVLEFDYLMEALCGDQEDLRSFVLKYDSATSSITDGEVMAKMCDLLLKSTHFFAFSNNAVARCEWSVASASVSVMGATTMVPFPKAGACVDSSVVSDNVGCLTAIPADVREIYKAQNANYVAEDTVLFTNVKTMMQSIQTDVFDIDAVKKERSVELQFILDAMFLKLKYEVSAEQLMALEPLIENRARNSSRQVNHEIFAQNVLQLIPKSIESNIVRDNVNTLVKTTDNNVQNPNKYIEYATFSEKMKHLSEDDLIQFAINLDKAKDGVTFMTSHMEDINNESERNLIMSGIYGEAVLMYVVISFIYLVSYLVRTIYGESIDALLGGFVTRRRLK